MIASSPLACTVSLQNQFFLLLDLNDRKKKLLLFLFTLFLIHSESEVCHQSTAHQVSDHLWPPPCSRHLSPSATSPLPLAVEVRDACGREKQALR